MYELVRYHTPDGKEVVSDWLRKLRDLKARMAIDRRIVRMELGNFGDHKFCRNGVWELRIDIGAGYRLYYSLAGAEVILLLCGGDKSTQGADIDRACEYLSDWQRGPNHERSSK